MPTEGETTQRGAELLGSAWRHAAPGASFQLGCDTRDIGSGTCRPHRAARKETESSKKTCFQPPALDGISLCCKGDPTRRAGPCMAGMQHQASAKAWGQQQDRLTTQCIVHHSIVMHHPEASSLASELPRRAASLLEAGFPAASCCGIMQA